MFKSARRRTEDGRDVKRSAVINDNSGWLITESKEVLRIWATYLKELLNGKGSARCIDLPSSVGRERGGTGGDRTGRNETAMHTMKKARRQERMKCG